jgi:carbonic anhydrase
VNVSQTTIVRDAWMRRQSLAVHGWVYDIRDGLLRDLGMCVTAETEIAARSEEARAEVARTNRSKPLS